MVKTILRLENLGILLTSLYFYQQLHGNWLLFILILLSLDVSMIGYLKNKKIGSLLYNLVHNYLLALLLIAIGIYLQRQEVTALGLIVSAHVGIDRFVGYGLKYPTSFKETHLKRI